jgi:hypothetical protein
MVILVKGLPMPVCLDCVADQTSACCCQRHTKAGTTNKPDNKNNQLVASQANWSMPGHSEPQEACEQQHSEDEMRKQLIQRGRHNTSANTIFQLLWRGVMFHSCHIPSSYFIVPYKMFITASNYCLLEEAVTYY